MDCTISLISSAWSKDAYGVDHPTETSREIFARVESVSRAEFFEGGRNGLNPEYKFTVFAEDYQGEQIVSYNGSRYGIYRTYRATGDYMELYAERKGGLNGQGKR